VCSERITVSQVFSHYTSAQKYQKHLPYTDDSIYKYKQINTGYGHQLVRALPRRKAMANFLPTSCQETQTAIISEELSWVHGYPRDMLQSDDDMFLNCTRFISRTL
jgi:hypothetical protein